MNKFVIIAIIAVVILVVVAVFSSMLPLGINYGTGLSAHTDTWWPTNKRLYDKEKGELWLKSAGREVMAEEKYIVSWQPNQMSQTITARADFKFNPCYGSDHVNQWVSHYMPGQYLGRYWFFAMYTDVNGKTIDIINMRDNWWNPDYVEMIDVPPSSDFSSTGFYFPNAKQHYKTYGFMEGSSKQKTWWLAGASDWCTNSLDNCRDRWWPVSTHTYTFKLRDSISGKITLDWVVESATVETKKIWDFPPLYDDIWHDTIHTMCQDEAYLASGEGEIIIESTNAVDAIGPETTPETDKVYTKYVYEEGLTVDISVDAGFSGACLTPGTPGYGKGWVLSIYDSSGSNRHSENIPDDVRGYSVYYTIPSGAFIANDPNDNEWRVVLKNTLFDQSETRLFVVDKFEYMPGQTTIEADKNRYIQWEIGRAHV